MEHQHERGQAVHRLIPRARRQDETDHEQHQTCQYERHGRRETHARHDESVRPRTSIHSRPRWKRHEPEWPEWKRDCEHWEDMAHPNPVMSPHLLLNEGGKGHTTKEWQCVERQGIKEFIAGQPAPFGLNLPNPRPHLRAWSRAQRSSRTRRRTPDSGIGGSVPAPHEQPRVRLVSGSEPNRDAQDDDSPLGRHHGCLLHHEERPSTLDDGPRVRLLGPCAAR